MKVFTFVLVTTLAFSGCASNVVVPVVPEIQFIETARYFIAAKTVQSAKVISESDWSARVALGIPSDAWRCSPTVYAYHRRKFNEKVGIVGIIVQNPKGKLQKYEPEQIILDDAFVSAKVIFGIVGDREGNKTPPGEYLLLPETIWNEVGKCIQHPPQVA